MTDEKIRDLLNIIIDEQIKDHEIYSSIGVVSDIDETTRTCIVTPLEGAAIRRVRLQSIISGETGIFIKPEDGSKVVVNFLNYENAYITKTSDIEKILITIGETVINISDNLLTLNIGDIKIEGDGSTININNGKNGGLVITDSLTTKLNALITEINALKEWANTHVHATAALGPPVVPTVLFTGSFSNFNSTDYENTDVNH